MSATVFKKSSTKWVLLGGVAAFLIIYGLWVMLWSMQGQGLKRPRIGFDTCSQCGMHLSDLRFVVSVLDQDESGNEITRHFDDIGCFIEFAKKNNKQNWEGEAYDVKTSEAINLDHALFHKTKQETPMGTGWVATKNHDKSLPQKKISEILSE